MNTNAIQWRNGLKDGIPICLGYFAVSFTFGIMASGAGLSPWQAVIMSFTNLTSADEKTPFFHRFLIGYGVTDEIFGVSVCRPGRLSPFFSYGLIAVAVPGWTLGTLLGAVSGDFLPPRILSALNVALYGMFLAVIIPPAKGNRILSGIIVVSMVCSLIFAAAPVLNTISSGFKIIILTLLIAGAAAYLFPVKETGEEQHE